MIATTTVIMIITAIAATTQLRIVFIRVWTVIVADIRAPLNVFCLL